MNYLLSRSAAPAAIVLLNVYSRILCTCWGSVVWCGAALVYSADPFSVIQYWSAGSGSPGFICNGLFSRVACWFWLFLSQWFPWFVPPVTWAFKPRPFSLKGCLGSVNKFSPILSSVIDLALIRLCLCPPAWFLPPLLVGPPDLKPYKTETTAGDVKKIWKFLCQQEAENVDSYKCCLVKWIEALCATIQFKQGVCSQDDESQQQLQREKPQKKCKSWVIEYILRWCHDTMFPMWLVRPRCSRPPLQWWGPCTQDALRDVIHRYLQWKHESHSTPVLSLGCRRQPPVCKMIFQ